jgi:hypothetical protein
MLGEHERQGGLGELRRLQVEGPKIDPAPRPPAYRAEEQHVYEQHGNPDVHPMGPIGERAVVDRQADEEGRQAQQDAVDLRDVEGATAGGAVDLRDADHAEGHEGHDHGPIDVKVQATLEHLLPVS